MLGRQKGFAHVVLILFLIVGLAIALVAIKDPTNLFPKAFQDNPNKLTAQEAYSQLDTYANSRDGLLAAVNDPEFIKAMNEAEQDSFQNLTLEERIKRLRKIFNVPIIVPDDQVEEYVKKFFKKNGLEINGLMTYEYVVNVPDKCYVNSEDIDPVTGLAQAEPICPFDSAELSQFGSEILEVMMPSSKFVQGVKDLDQRYTEIKGLVENSGILSRTRMEDPGITKIIGAFRDTDSQLNKEWVKYVSTALQQDLNDYKDEDLSELQAAARKKLPEKLEEFSQKRQTLANQLETMSIFKQLPQDSKGFAQENWKGTSRFVLTFLSSKQINKFYDEQIRHFTNDAKTKLTAFLDALVKKDYQIINRQILRQYNLSEDTPFYSVANKMYIDGNGLGVYGKSSASQVQDHYKLDKNANPNIIKPSSLEYPSLSVSTNPDTYHSDDEDMRNFSISIKDVFDQGGKIYRQLDDSGNIEEGLFVVTIPTKSIKISTD